MNPAPGASFIYVVDPDFPEGPHQRITPDYADAAVRRGEIRPDPERPGFAVLCPSQGIRTLSGAERRRNHLRRQR